MKIPRIMFPEVEVTVNRPILGRLHVFFVAIKCIRFCKFNIMLGNRKIDEYTALLIPKIKVVDGS